MFVLQVKANSAACAAQLMKHGYTLCTGGTENHLLLWDLRPQVSSLHLSDDLYSITSCILVCAANTVVQRIAGADGFGCYAMQNVGFDHHLLLLWSLRLQVSPLCFSSQH